MQVVSRTLHNGNRNWTKSRYTGQSDCSPCLSIDGRKHKLETYFTFITMQVPKTCNYLPSLSEKRGKSGVSVPLLHLTFYVNFHIKFYCRFYRAIAVLVDRLMAGNISWKRFRNVPAFPSPSDQW